MKDKEVLVVGAGIGGLVLARALVRLGVSVTLVEQSDAIRASGAGITLGANAMRALDTLELAHQVAASGHELSAGAITDQAGRVLAKGDLERIEQKYGKAYALGRPQLHALLAAGLEQPRASSGWGAHVALRLGQTVTAFGPVGARMTVSFSDGSQEIYDAVIGADGIRSTVRTLTFGENPPRYAGYTCWRWVGSIEGGPCAAIEMWGAGRRVGLVPLGGDHVYAFFVANAPAGTPDDPAQRHPRRLSELYADFAGDVPRVLAALERGGPHLMHHDIEEIDQRPWTQGPIALLGDAAHAMTPNFGQGAAMAIEDAVVLARELVAHERADVALHAYEARRRPRVEGIQRGARKLGKIAQWQAPLLIGMRNLALRCAPASASARALERIVSYVP